MDLALIIGEEIKDTLTPKIFSKIKELNYDFIKTLKIEAEEHYKELFRNDEIINNYWEGLQWPGMIGKNSNNTLAYSPSGKMVWDLAKTYPNFNDKVDKPKRVVNIIKTKFNTIIANHAEVDPFPVANSPSDYNNKKELERKINLLFDIGFNIENNIDELYEILLKDVYRYGVSYIQIIVDKDKSETQIPIKIRIIPHEDIRYDPQAEKLETADYMYHKIKIRYWELLATFDYSHTNLNENEPEKEQMIDMEIWYIRTKNKDNKTLWFKMYFYENKWIKPKGKEEQVLKDMIDEKLPYELIRIDITKKAHGEPLMVDLFDMQTQYNKVLTELDWHMNKKMNPPKTSNIPKDEILQGDRPEGIIAKGVNENLEVIESSIIPISEFESWKTSIEGDIDKYLGNINTLEGRGVSGYASAKLLQTKMQAVQVKLKIAEKHLLKSLENIAYKYLYVFIKYLGTNSIYLFDSETQKDIEITKTDLQNNLYKIRIDIKDINLMSRESKYEILTQFMQYSQGNPIIMYLMALTAQNGMPNIFPKNVMEYFKMLFDIEIDKIKAQKNPQGSTLAPVQGQEGGGQIPEDITPEQLQQEVEGIKQELLNSGIKEDQISQLDEVIINGNSDGALSNREILDIYRTESNKLLGVVTPGEQNG